MIKFASLFLLVVLSFSAFSQKAPPSASASSSASSMQQVQGNVSVDHSTGTFTYAVLLFTVGNNEFSYPVAASYSASGIKKDQRNNQIGVGWGLDFAGVVTRTIQVTKVSKVRLL